MLKTLLIDEHLRLRTIQEILLSY